MDDLESDQLIICRSAPSDKEQGGITAVDYLRICKPLVLLIESRKMPTFVFQEIAHPRPPREYELRDILDDLCFLLRGEGCEPLRQSLGGV